jgi:hypothetical protein
MTKVSDFFLDFLRLALGGVSDTGTEALRGKGTEAQRHRGTKGMSCSLKQTLCLLPLKTLCAFVPVHFAPI